MAYGFQLVAYEGQLTRDASPGLLSYKQERPKDSSLSRLAIPFLSVTPCRGAIGPRPVQFLQDHQAYQKG